MCINNLSFCRLSWQKEAIKNDNSNDTVNFIFYVHKDIGQFAEIQLV